MLMGKRDSGCFAEGRRGQQSVAERGDGERSCDEEFTCDGGRDDCGDVSIYVSGAGRRKRAGRAQRHFFAGCGAV